MVPGKSLAIISRTGQVWHPMGKPRGLARSSRAPRERRPAAAAFVAEYLRNSLLEMAGIDPPYSLPLGTVARIITSSEWLPEQVKRAAAMAGTPKREKQGELKFAPTRGRKA